MKILFVTPYLPSPARFGAQRRIDGLMRGLAERHELSVLSFATPGLDVAGLDLGTAVAATRAYCEKVVTVPLPETSTSSRVATPQRGQAPRGGT